MIDRTTTLPASVIQQIWQAVGPQGVLAAAADLEPHVVDWRVVLATSVLSD